MPDTVDHRAGMHRLAQERRKAGLPSWRYTLDLSPVWHDEPLDFGQRRDAVVARIRASAWFRGCGPGDELSQAVEELADTKDINEFDSVFDAIYDLADYARAWIRTF